MEQQSRPRDLHVAVVDLTGGVAALVGMTRDPDVVTRACAAIAAAKRRELARLGEHLHPVPGDGPQSEPAA